MPNPTGCQNDPAAEPSDTAMMSDGGVGRDPRQEVGEAHGEQASGEEEAPVAREEVHHEAAAHAEEAARRLPRRRQDAERDRPHPEDVLDDGEEDEEAVRVHVLETVASDDDAGYALRFTDDDVRLQGLPVVITVRVYLYVFQCADTSMRRSRGLGATHERHPTRGGSSARRSPT